MSSFAMIVKKLWDTCNIKGMVILSLLFQFFLILFAPLRKQTGGKWVWFVTIPLWIAYLFADLAAVFTIGLILRAEPNGMLALWSSFLLLHLGGPDAITSFSIEDNELWIRHLLGLLSRVGSSVYIILLSLSNDMLWFPNLLVLIAGIIKYAERNRAFYLASFDRFGDNWKKENEHVPPIPEQFSRLVRSWKLQPARNPSTIKGEIAKAWGQARQLGDKIRNRFGFGVRNQGNHPVGISSSNETTKGIPTYKVALYLLGVIKNLLVGPPLSSFEEPLLHIKTHEMLRAMEIHLSLLYELLHTKLPVIDSKIGYVCRIVNLGCILGALVSFSLLKKQHHKFLKFDIWLTYGLLTGALVLDLISVMLLISSDWITMAHFQERRDSEEFINKSRWSNLVPQLNIFSTCHLLNKEEGLNFLGLRSLVKKLRRIRWVKFEVFRENQEWEFISTKLLQQKKNRESERVNRYMWLWETSLDFWLKIFPSYEEYVSTFDKFEFVESLLMWHIVTEFYYRVEGSITGSSSGPPSLDYRRICKLFSDYMFYLLVMEPTVIGVSPNSFKIIFDFEDNKTLVWLDNKTLVWLVNEMRCESSKTFFEKMDKISKGQNEHIGGSSKVNATYLLAKHFYEKEPHSSGNFPWEKLAEVWVLIVCHAAKTCQPIVHARQVSKGGQLLTFVWLMMNYCGLTPKNKLLTYDQPTNTAV